MPSLTVDDNGTEFYYIDSGAPTSNSPESAKGYLTLMAIHGMSFTSHTFEPMISVASMAGVRFVAINRRNYPGSSPLAEEDARVLSSGTEDEKEAFLRARGVELARFIDRFIELNSIPPPNDSGLEAGGIIVLGWSLGCSYVFSALVNIDSLPSASQARLGAYLRAYIMYDCPTVAIGTPLPPQLWSPLIDTTLPEKLRVPAQTAWLTSYFEHGDFSTRDPDVLSYHLPALFRAPTIFNMSDAERARVVWEATTHVSEIPFMLFSREQISQVYKKACFDREVRARFPRMAVWNVVARNSLPHGILGAWAMEEDNKAHGGDCVKFRVVPRGNHFLQWDEPELLFNICMECL